MKTANHDRKKSYLSKPIRKGQGIVMDGQRKTLEEWVEHYGIGYHVVYNRLVSGWDIRSALTHHVYKPGMNGRDNFVNTAPAAKVAKKDNPNSAANLARASLPEDLRPIYDELLAAYKYHGSMQYGTRMFPPKIISELVKDGWRRKKSHAQ